MANTNYTFDRHTNILTIYDVSDWNMLRGLNCKGVFIHANAVRSLGKDLQDFLACIVYPMNIGNPIYLFGDKGLHRIL